MAWDLEVEGPNTTTYTATTAAKMETICCNATVKLSSGPKPEVGHTVKGIAFNTSFEIVAETQVWSITLIQFLTMIKLPTTVWSSFLAEE